MPLLGSLKSKESWTHIQEGCGTRKPKAAVSPNIGFSPRAAYENGLPSVHHLALFKYYAPLFTAPTIRQNFCTTVLPQNVSVYVPFKIG